LLLSTVDRRCISSASAKSRGTDPPVPIPPWRGAPRTACSAGRLTERHARQTACSCAPSGHSSLGSSRNVGESIYPAQAGKEETISPPHAPESKCEAIATCPPWLLSGPGLLARHGRKTPRARLLTWMRHACDSRALDAEARATSTYCTRRQAEGRQRRNRKLRRTIGHLAELASEGSRQRRRPSFTLTLREPLQHQHLHHLQFPAIH